MLESNIHSVRFTLNIPLSRNRYFRENSIRELNPSNKEPSALLSKAQIPKYYVH